VRGIWGHLGDEGAGGGIIIKFIFEKWVWGSAYWIHMAQDGVLWWDFVCMVMNVWVP
jgi:hypothetical protein